MQEGSEITIRAAASVLAPNSDAALLGNPEELNKWSLGPGGELASWPWPTDSKQRIGPLTVWRLVDQLPDGCAPGKGQVWGNSKMGMAGRFLRVAHAGYWTAVNDSDNSPGYSGTPGGCGADLTVVAAGATAANETSVVLIKLGIADTRNGSLQTESGALNITYFKVVVDQNTSALISAAPVRSGNEFYRAIAAQDIRWHGKFVTSGTTPTVPSSDQRYVDTATALLTMYQTLDRGLVPEYGGGKFWWFQ